MRKELEGRYKSAGAFVLGAILMVAMYFLFGAATTRTRTAGITDAEDLDAGQTHSGTTSTSIVKVAGDSDPVVSFPAFLGVQLVSVDSVIASQLDIPGGRGVLINSVVPDSPAEAAGLRRGDVIVTLNSRNVKGVDSVSNILRRLTPGDTVRVVFIRNGVKDIVYVELAEAPGMQRTAQTPAPSESGWGVTLSPVSPAVRESLDIPSDVNGVAVLSVAPGGTADRAGLMPGDVIRGIDRTPVNDMDDFFTVVASDTNDTAVLDVYGRGRMRYVPMDTSAVRIADQVQNQTTLGQKIYAVFTGGTPFSTDDDEEEEGPKGGKFAQDDVQLTADNVTLAAGDNAAFNRPSEVVGDVNTGGTSSSGGTSSAGGTGMNRPSEVPPQLGGPTSDTVLFIGLLLLLILYLAYREFHRPPEPDGNK